MKAKALAFKERLPLENGFRTVSQSILWAHIGNHTGLREELYIIPMPELRYSDLVFSSYICALRSEHCTMSDGLVDEIEERCEFVDLIISVPNKQFNDKEENRDT